MSSSSSQSEEDIYRNKYLDSEEKEMKKFVQENKGNPHNISFWKKFNTEYHTGSSLRNHWKLMHKSKKKVNKIVFPGLNNESRSLAKNSKLKDKDIEYYANNILSEIQGKKSSEVGLLTEEIEKEKSNSNENNEITEEKEKNDTNLDKAESFDNVIVYDPRFQMGNLSQELIKIEEDHKFEHKSDKSMSITLETKKIGTQKAADKRIGLAIETVQTSIPRQNSNSSYPNINLINSAEKICKRSMKIETYSEPRFKIPSSIRYYHNDEKLSTEVIDENFKRLCAIINKKTQKYNDPCKIISVLEKYNGIASQAVNFFTSK